MKIINFIVLLFGISLFPHYSNGQKDEILVTDLLKIKTATGIQISPDKQWVLFQQNGIRPNAEKQVEFDNFNQLMLYSLKDKSLKAISNDNKPVSTASFSPDGKYISFIRTNESKTQLYLLDLKGGEPFPIGNSAYAPTTYNWSENGKEIYFSSSISIHHLVNDSLLNARKELPNWNFEKSGIHTNEFLKKSTNKPNPNGSINEIRAYLAQNELDKKAKVFNKLNFQEETSTNSDLKTNVLFKISLDNNQHSELISPLFDNWLDYQVSNDLSKIYAIRIKLKDIHPDKIQETEIVEYDLKTKNSAIIRSKQGYRFSNLLLSPNEKQLVFSMNNIGVVQNASYYVLNLDKIGVEKSIPIDRVVTQMQFNEESSKLYFTIQDHGGATLHSFQLDNGELKSIRNDISEGILGFDEKDGLFVYAKTKISNPFELYTWDGSNEEQITKLNSEWLRDKFISIPEKHTFKNEKGLEIDYWIMKPKGFEINKKFPLLVEIHGGPTAMWGTGELSMWHEFQYFASKGYGVVYSNPRGSGGYGTTFMAANVKDWGKGPMNDVMKALDFTINQGWVDTTKLAVTGGSYAGYLVAYMIGHTNRFKVGCAQRGVYELSTFFGEGNAWRLVPNYFGSYPWNKETKQLLDKESPLSYVKNIHTPLIIFHGENDLRTGVIQSEMLYKSLKVLDREVEYVRHPGASHEITRSGNNRQRIDQMLRTYEFFSRYIP